MSPAARGRALGRRPPKRAPSLRLGRILTDRVPPVPPAADHFGRVDDWGLYGNDQFGTCGPASVGNLRKLTSGYLTDTEQSPTVDAVFDLYRRSGNPRFNPRLPAADPRQDDNGVVMQTMLEALLRDGIGGVKPLAFAEIDPGDLRELWAGVALFGGLLLGVDLDAAQQAQTDVGVWDYQPSQPWGGHAVLTGRYTDVIGTADDRTGVVTWAELVDMTDAFIGRQVDEAWVVIWPEHLHDRTFLDGVDLERLAADYRQLTGRDFPAPTVPSPAPDSLTRPWWRVLWDWLAGWLRAQPPR